MNDPERDSAETIVADGTASVAGWTQSLLGRLGASLQKNGAKIQDAASPAPSSPTSPGVLAAEPERPATERAEERLDKAGEKIGIFAAAFSHQVRRSVALAREEAEDVLADAQFLRHK